MGIKPSYAKTKDLYDTNTIDDVKSAGTLKVYAVYTYTFKAEADRGPVDTLEELNDGDYTLALAGEKLADGAEVSYNGATAVIELNVKETEFNSDPFAPGDHEPDPANPENNKYGITAVFTDSGKASLELSSLGYSIEDLRALLTVKVYYNDGNSDGVVVDDYTLEGAIDGAENKIKVSYSNGKDTVYVYITVTVKTADKVVPVLESITVNATVAEGVVFTTDTTIDGINSLIANGKITLDITANYNYGTEKVTEGYTLSGEIKAGTSTITVTYTGCTDTFEINVLDKDDPAVNVEIVKVELKTDLEEVYANVTDADIKALSTVTVYYSDGTSEVITDYTLVLTNGENTVSAVATFNGIDSNAVVLKVKTQNVDGDDKPVTVIVTAALNDGAKLYEGSAVTEDDVKALLNVTVTETCDGVDTAVVSPDYSVIIPEGMIDENGKLVAGAYTLNVVYNGKVATVEVTVEKREIVTPPEGTVLPEPDEGDEVIADGKNGYYVALKKDGKIYSNSSLDYVKTLLVVKVYYKDGSDWTVLTADDYELGGSLLNLDEDGKATLSVIIGGNAVATITVPVENAPVQGAVIESIHAELAQNVTVYTSTSLDELARYLTVTATYTNKTVEEVTGYTLSGTLSAGTSQITVKYNGFEYVIEIPVLAVELDSITVAYEQNSRVYGTTPIDSLKNDMVVTAYYNDGTSKIVTDYILSGNLADIDKNTGYVTVEVVYGGISAYINVLIETVTDPDTGDKVLVTVKGIEAIFTQGSAVIYTNTGLETLRNLLKVVATFDENGSERTEEVSDYTLSGELVVGKSVIAVNYNGAVAQFEVNVTGKSFANLRVDFAKGSAKIYKSTPLAELKNYLTVIAEYDDGSSETVTVYDLAGEYSADGTLLTVTVTYDDGTAHTATFTVQLETVMNPSGDVEAADFTGITVEYKEEGHTVYEGDDLETLKGYLTVTAHFNNAPDTEVSGYTLHGTLEEGVSVITVKYGGLTDTVRVPVTAPDLIPDEGDVEGAGLTVTFSQGNTKIYSTTGIETLRSMIKVVAHYTNGVDEVVTDYTLSGNLSAIDANGYATVTVAYKNVSKTVKVLIELEKDPITGEPVEPVKPVEITDLVAEFRQDGTVIYAGASLDTLKGYLTVTAELSDGNKIKVTDYELSGELLAGTATVTVSYSGRTAKFTVNVTANEVVAITASINRTSKVYSVTPFDALRPMLTVKVTYADGTEAETQDYVITGDLSVLDENGFATINILYSGDYNLTPATVKVLVEHETVVDPDTGDTVVKPVVITSIKATLADNVPKFYTSTELKELRGYLKVEAFFGSDTEGTVVSDYELIGKLMVGKSVITVQYNGVTDTFEVEVSAVAVSSITAIYDAGYSKVYASKPVNELADGLTVTAYYTDGSSAYITDYTLSGDLSDLDANGYATVTVTLVTDADISAEFLVKVEVETDENGKPVIDPETGKPVPATLTKITAEIADGYKIYETSSLDELRSYLTVLAFVGEDENGTEIADYTLSGTLHAGVSVITASYNGKTADFEVTVIDNSLVGIKAAYAPSGKVYGTMPLNGLKNCLTVTAIYADGTEIVLGAEDYTLSGTLTAGTASEITVTYLKQTAVFFVNVEAETLERIETVITDANAVIYTSSTLDDIRNIIEVKAYTQSAANGEVITDYELTGEIKEGISWLTVSYNGLTDTFSINVQKVEFVSAEISFRPDSEIYQSTPLNSLKDMLEVKATFSDGSVRVLDADEYTLSGKLEQGKNCEISVLYNGKVVASFQATVSDKLITGIKVTFNQDGAEFYPSNELSDLVSKLTVIAMFDDGTEKAVSPDDYTLTGTLTQGNCTIYVAYNGLQASFNVYVTGLQATALKVDFKQNAHKVYSTTDVNDLRELLTVTAYYNDGTSGEVTDYALDADLTTLDKNGNATAYVTYGGLDPVSFSVYVESRTDEDGNVVPVTIISLTAELKLPEGTAVYAGDDIETLRKYLAVTATYDDGSDPAVVSEYSLEGTLNAGDNILTAVYNGKRANFKVTAVSRNVTGISVQVVGNMKIYLNTPIELLAGIIEVTEFYADGSSSITTDYTLSGDLAAGNVITVTSNKDNSITATFTVTVETVKDPETGENVPATLEKITAEFNYLTDTEGNELPVYTTDLDGLKAMLTVKAYVIGDETGTVLAADEYTLTGDLIPGLNDVVVEYQGKTAVFSVRITGAKVVSVSVERTAYNSVYPSSTVNELKGMIAVTAYLSDGTTRILNANEYDLRTRTGGSYDSILNLVKGAACDIYVVYTAGGAEYEQIVPAVSFSVQVENYTVENILVEFAKDSNGFLDYTVYETTDLDTLRNQIVVTALFSSYTDSDGTLISPEPAVVGNYEIAVQGGALKLGDNLLMITYAGKYGEVKVKVVEPAVTGITAEIDGSVKIYAGSTLDDVKAHLTVTATLADGTERNITDYSLQLVNGTELVTGANRILVKDTASGYECYITVIVEAATFKGIVVETPAAGVNVYEYATEDDIKSQITVYAEMTDGQRELLANGDYTLVFDLATSDEVTVNYNGASQTFKVNITKNSVVRIAAVFSPTGKIFEGSTKAEIESYLKIAAYYSDGTFKVIKAADCNITFTAPVAGQDCTITVEYEGQSCEVVVTVESVSPDSLTVKLDTVPVVYEDSITLEYFRQYLTVKANYGTDSVEVAGYVLTAADGALNEDGTLKSGTHVIYVNYGGRKEPVTVTIAAVTVTGLTAEYQQKTIYSDEIGGLTLDDIVAQFGQLSLTTTRNDGSNGTLSIDDVELSIVGGSITGSGKYTVTVTYKENRNITAQFTLEVTERYARSITVEDFKPTETIYSSTDVQDLLKYFTVVIHYNDGTASEPISLATDSTGFAISGDLSIAENGGKPVITLTYATTLNGQTVNVPVTFDDFEVTLVAPESFTVEFDADGAGEIFDNQSLDDYLGYITATLIYNDGSRQNIAIEDCTVSGDFSKAGTATVTVTYTLDGVEYIASFDVNVTALTSQLKVVVDGEIEIYDGDDINGIKDKLTVTLEYNNGEVVNIAANDYTLTLNGSTVTVTLNSDTSKTATFNITVNTIVLESITVTYQPADGTVITGTTPLATIKSMLTVTAHYSDGSTKVLTADEYDLVPPTGDLSAGGNYTYTVNYEGKSATQIIYIAPVTTPGNNEDNNGGGVPGWLIGVLIGLAALVILVVVVLLVVLKKLKATTNNTTVNETTIIYQGDDDGFGDNV